MRAIQKTPELEALEQLEDVALTGNGHAVELIRRLAQTVRMALPPAPPDPKACTWCQEDRHYNCSGARKLETDKPGQASGVCECKHG